MADMQKSLIWVAIAAIGLAVMYFHPIRQDHELTGVWKVEWTQMNGTPPRRERAFWVFRPGKLLVVRDDVIQRFDISCDPSKSPRELNSEMNLAADGIYEVEGETLRVSQASLVTERPTEFVTRFGDLVTVTELSRMQFGTADPSVAELQAKLTEVFGPRKTYPPRIEFDPAAEDFVQRLVRETPFSGPVSSQLPLVNRVWWMETEVNNGGFHQFYFNAYGDNALDVIADLNTIGATKTATLVRRGCDLFPNAAPARDSEARRKQLDSFTLDDYETLRDLTNQFYARREDLNVLLKRYWEEAR